MIPSRRSVLWFALVAVVAVVTVGVWQWRTPKRPPRRTARPAAVERAGPVLKLAPKPPDTPAVAIDLEAELRALALRNPMKAMQLAREGLEGPALEQTFLFALRKLASVDLQGAAAFVQTMPADKLQLLATEEIARIYFGLGVGAALGWVNLLPSGTAMHQRAINEIVGLWAAQDRVAATRFVEGLPPGTLQNGAAVRAAQVIGAKNTYEALTWALTLASPMREAVLQSISGDWSDKDPAVAARWFATQSIDAVPNIALHAALAEWLRKDQAAALLFVRTLSRDRQLEAVKFIAPLAAEQDPRAAALWSRQFSPAVSEVARTAVFNRWLDQDPAAAQAWMNQRLSPAQRAAILAGRK